MPLEAQRRQAYELLDQVAAKLKAAHQEVTKEASSVLPELAEVFAEYHTSFAKEIATLVARSRKPVRDDQEPVWLLQHLLNLTPARELTYADVDAFDRVQRRLGLPIEER